MSDSMDKTEVLTSKQMEEEEEEMKRELIDMKLYETWYTYKDMKQILGFINESKDMANMVNDEKDVQKESMQSSGECTSEIMLKADLEQELEIQEHNDASQSNLYKPNHTSPIHERMSDHDCGNSDLATAIADSRNSMYRGKTFDSEDMFIKLQDNSNMRDSYSHSTNRYISLKSKNSLQDSDVINSAETKMDTYSESELWHSWHRTTDTKFQWGSPIQVGLAKDNLDKKLLKNIKTEQNQMECTNKHNNERPNKRKSTLILSSFSDIIYSSSDEDESIIKKKKIQSYEDTNRVLRSHKAVCTAKCSEKNRNQDNDSNPSADNLKIENFEAEFKTKSIESSPSESISLCPKKVPQNVRRNIIKRRECVINVSPNSPLAHSSSEKQSAINLISKDKSNILTDEEILIELEKDNANDNIKTMFENTETKPLLKKGLSSRINDAYISLEKLHDKIEAHAAGCEQYTSDNEYENDLYLVENKSSPISINNTEILECGVCSKYKTTNGIHYEEHVNSCLQKQHEEESSNEYSSNEISNIPNSPVRCFRPISEQTDSHIDYRKQFPSNSKTQICSSRKRKLIVFLINNTLSLTLDGSWIEITFSATVPGGIYTDLNKAHIIPNNLNENNDVINRWVGNQSVIYTKRFYVNDTLLNAPKVVLIFHGVDTFATILLNGHEVGETSNMFLRYIFDVTKYLEKEENLLEIFFSSPVKIAEILYNKQALKYVIPPICNPDSYNGECHVNYIRKMQASFAWDWGPAFPSMEIIPINEIYIMDVTTDIHKKENFWNIIITIFLEVTSQRNITCHISSVLNINDQLNIHNSSNVNLHTNDKDTKCTILLKVPTNLVNEWWPNGYGNQTLYSLTVTAATSADVKQKIIHVGFRTVKLIQKPLKVGLSFYFQVNNVPIFAKGSNFIPASIFPELTAKTDTIKHLLRSVKEANMNMLRVWGGGLYESELFYNIADEYGIMIWQDFMFACGMYPTTGEFLESIKKEVIQNVQRLKNHPSIVLWAGNNENEAALYGNWYGTGTKQIYKTDYIKLYVDLIKKEVEQLDSTRPFVVSSPSNGLYTEKYNYIGKDPYLKTFGDVHYYNYFNNGWDMHQYPRVRFSSEYGFQSLPSIYTMLPIVSTITDLDIHSDFFKHRQHLPLGTEYLINLISKNLKLPDTQDTLKRFEDYIYLSQINQAVSVKIQTEFYRQSKSDLNEIGEGMTMGALYWQLNDVWQAPSWSSIDFDGRWKMLHYYAVEFFAPIIVTYYIRNMHLSIHIVSDKTHSVKNATLEVNLYALNNIKPVQSYIYPNITIEANAVTTIDDNWLKHSWILTSTILNECQSNSTTKSNCITTLTLKDKTGITLAPRNYIYPSNVLKNIALPIANVSIKMNDNHLPGKSFNYPDIEFELITDNITLFVWLEAGNICGRFSENGFHMFENKKSIIFLACEFITPEVLRKSLKVTTLSGIY
ncbi:hypothetical protein E2986_08369 [Frieseomelitta varia]|uniref:Beta-mannosidase n=1 Tax=Frieseomelitta varia TaxID=561572 RepID=A0A833SIP3_9HYME|nr:hypothetical protein E2986_08369 [Frieseomelitta varia]